MVTYYDVYQRANSTWGHLVHIVAYSQLADAVITPTIYLAVLGYYHAGGLTARDINNLLPSQIGGHLSWRALIRADITANLSTIILSPGIHLD